MRRVILVGGAPESRSALREVIENAGMNLIEARTPEEAFDALAHEPIDFVVAGSPGAAAAMPELLRIATERALDRPFYVVSPVADYRYEAPGSRRISIAERAASRRLRVAIRGALNRHRTIFREDDARSIAIGVDASAADEADWRRWTAPSIPIRPGVRPVVRGKSIRVGDDTLAIRGVTYGPFRPEADGSEYHTPEVVARDFSLMVANGINAVRTYTMPPPWFFDEAARAGIRVMAGMPWEQHVAFLDSRASRNDIAYRVRRHAESCAGHPALLAYTVGNEVPASIVRWYGRKKVERFLERLYDTIKEADPDGLVTYVNFPSTEYLRLPFVDFASFNVYLESRDKLAGYLARLQNLVGEKPLVMAEIGLDSMRNGLETQAETLSWQVRTTFDAGCAGCFLFAWTDEWYRGGAEIEDWAFGLIDRDRQPKPALARVRRAYADTPFPCDAPLPRITVAVCTYNGSRTLDETLAGIRRLDYPDYDVLVVDDGSTDAVPKIVRRHPVRYIRTLNRGLSSARNTALEAATGEIIAYIDDDAVPDPHWLHYIAMALSDGEYAGAGGPNIPPPDDGFVADCVARAPGGASHVLLTDTEAEHIPGCNMAFRCDRLAATGGFDDRFRAAGDDVDLCWRIQQNGWKIGFSPAAVVWHHRRNTIRGYWRQQKGYGRAEAMLEVKWPEKYNNAGHPVWSGRLYGIDLVRMLGGHRERIYHGTWGTAAFQSVYDRPSSLYRYLPAMPEWYLLIVIFAGLSALGAVWPPMLAALPFLAISALVPVAQAAVAAFGRPTDAPRGRVPFRRKLLVLFLHLLQPAARLIGRISHGLTPWRRRGAMGYAIPRQRCAEVWSETWRAPEEWIAAMEKEIRLIGSVVVRGGAFDPWDLKIRGGLFGAVRLTATIEEHGSGRQLLRLRTRPRYKRKWFVLASTILALPAASAVADGAFVAAIVLFGFAMLPFARAVGDCAAATEVYLRALENFRLTISDESAPRRTGKRPEPGAVPVA